MLAPPGPPLAYGLLELNCDFSLVPVGLLLTAPAGAPDEPALYEGGGPSGGPSPGGYTGSVGLSHCDFLV